ncbi:MAG: AI-2E family transporter [Clostridia bacterium]|nr:AI-2E family transporter [Clostridia bacterium]
MLRKIVAYIKEKKAVTVMLVLMAVVTYYLLLTNFSKVWAALGGVVSLFGPVITGGIVAYLLLPAVRFFEERLFGRIKRRRLATAFAVALTFLLVLAVLALLFAMVIPQLIDSITLLIQNMDHYIASARVMLDSLQQQFAFFTPEMAQDANEVLDSWQDALTKLMALVRQNLSRILDAIMRVGSGIFDFLLGVIFSIYMLLDKKRIGESFARFFGAMLSKDSFTYAADVVQRCDKTFMKFLGSNLLDAIIVGAANFLFMLVMGMPYGLLISVIVGVTNFIPTFGPVIGAIPSVLILVLVSPVQAIWFLIFTIILQTVDGNILKPLLFGDSTGLRPVWTLAAIIVGGRLFGIWGMILGIPVLAVISQLVERRVSARIEEKEAERAEETEG